MERGPVWLFAALATLVFYAAAAALAWAALAVVWSHRPDPVATVLVVAGVTIAFGYGSYRFGTRAIVESLGAEPLAPQCSPELHRRVAHLSNRLDIEPPTVCVARMEMPNALALGGRRDGVLVLDVRLFRLLSGPELEGILAHELAHLRARDGLVGTLGATATSTVARLLGLLLLPAALLAVGVARSLALARGDSPAEMEATTAWAQAAVGSLAVVLLFGLTALLRAYSRRRELAADDTAVELTGNPRALASALATIRRASTPSGPLAQLYIHGDETGTLTRLLATHPPMDERIERLRRRDSDPRRGRQV
ncbi:M48 family metalloprotease [Halosegnis rubeus]|jgi:heat shock protein HtpX|uniref:M48 family metalloprotease n=1 Tax=Halosegnis rubeus TaxID=2212850 RepID=A0A5N5UI46_9EURY|nr:M48 family metalloprotease [Halosegnis rubeus]KAB7515703.1 M48 family metalloprotease [Halosegnis rubeus]KAB7517082.1 M48 family metalloprotease [Halosegnis rubeus]KAB7519790.1 M48 family metalloprotease [Halosegnis rubeus]